MKNVLLIMFGLAISAGHMAIGQEVSPSQRSVATDDIAYTLVVHLASGQQVGYLLSDEPKVTFSGEELLIATHMNQISYRAADVQKFTYRDANSSIADVLAPQCLFSFGNDCLKAEGLEPESELLFYTVDGRLLASVQADHYGSVIVRLASQHAQTCIVKTSVATFKLTKP